MLFFIESVSPEWTIATVSLMFSFTVSLKTSCHLPVVFDFMRTITLLVLGTIYIASKSGMSLLPTILVLRNVRVHVSFLNSSDMLSYIGTSIDKTLSLHTSLRVPNINPYLTWEKP